MQKQDQHIKNNPTHLDTVRLMKQKAMIGAKKNFIQRVVKNGGIKPDRESAIRVAASAFKFGPFKAHPETKQTPRSVRRVILDKRANCVDYCVWISTFLHAVGLPHYFVMVSQDPLNLTNYHHIFVQLSDGYIIDPVFGQDLTGNEHLKATRVFVPGKTEPFLSQQKIKIL